MEAPAPRRRSLRALVPTLAAIAAVALFIVAGNWQRDRMEQRLALRALVPTLAAIAAVALFIVAGNWQRDRMEQRLALRAQFEAATAAPPVALPDLRDWTPWRYRQVVVTGIFDAPHQILLDNKLHDSRSGYQVVTPLTFADGRAVLVNRGWVAGGATRVELPINPFKIGFRIASRAAAAALLSSAIFWLPSLTPRSLAA